MNKKNKLLLIFLLFGNLLFSQTIKINGRVVDSISNMSVAYTIITIECDTIKQTLFSDENGQFSFILNTTTIKNISLSTSCIGYIKYKTIIKDFSSSNNIDLLIRLQQDDKTLSEITVSKNRVSQKVDRTSYQFKPKELESATNSFQLLSLAPLLSIEGENILIKGKVVSEIFINGKPMLDNNILKTLPPELIDKVEIITNPGSQYELTNMGSIINIITKSGWQGKYGNLSVQLGTYHTYNSFFFFSTKSKHLDMNIVAGTNTYSKPISNKIERVIDKSILSQFSNNKSQSIQPSVSIGLDYKLSDNKNISFFNNVYIPLFNNKNDYNYYKISPITIMPELDFTQRSNSNIENYVIKNYINYTHQSPKSNFFVSFLYQNYWLQSSNMSDQYKINTNSFKQTNNSYLGEYTSQIEYSRTLVSQYSYTVGSKLILRRNTATYQLYKTDSISRELVKDTSEIFNNSFRGDQNIYSLYYNSNYKLNDKIEIMSGLRADYIIKDIVMSTKLFFLPNLTIQYTVNDNNSLKVDYRKQVYRPGVTYLNPFIDISDVRNNQTGNELLKTEILNTMETSYDYIFKKHFFSISFIYDFNKNSIEPFTKLVNDYQLISQHINLNKGTSLGGNLFYQVKIGDKLSISNNFFIRRLKLYFDNISSSRWVITSNLNISYSFMHNISTRLRLNYTSKSPVIQGYDSEFSGIELSINKFIGKKWSIEIKGRDFLKVNSIRQFHIVTPTFSQNNNRNLALNLYTINIIYNFGKDKYYYKTKVSINNEDLKN